MDSPGIVSTSVTMEKTKGCIVLPATVTNSLPEEDIIADEILIADSGSTDATLEIVSQVQIPNTSLRIIQREYVNPSDFKNWAISQASNGWVLTLDADERLTDNLRDEIRQTLATEPVFDAYQIPRNNIFLGKRVRYSGWQHDAPFRLFHRDRCRYDARRVHEHLLVASGKTATMKATILHNTCRSLEEMFTKSIRYGSLGAEDLEEAGKSIGVMSLFTRPVFSAFFGISFGNKDSEMARSDFCFPV